MSTIIHEPRYTIEQAEEENARLREALARATNAVRSEATRLWQVAYEADRAVERGAAHGR